MTPFAKRLTIAVALALTVGLAVTATVTSAGATSASASARPRPGHPVCHREIRNGKIIRVCRVMRCHKIRYNGHWVRRCPIHTTRKVIGIVPPPIHTSTPTPTGTPTGTYPGVTSPAADFAAAVRADFLTLVNQERGTKSAPALTMLDSVDQASDQWAQRDAWDYWDRTDIHTPSAQLSSELTPTGCAAPAGVAENVAAYGPPDATPEAVAQSLFNLWAADVAHQQIQDDPGMTQVSLGLAYATASASQMGTPIVVGVARFSTGADCSTSTPTPTDTPTGTPTDTGSPSPTASITPTP